MQSISYWLLLKQAGQDWLKHRSPRLGAALAYYAVFSLGPLLLIVVAVAGMFFGADAVRNSLEAQFKGLIGENGAQAIHAMIAGAASATTGKTASAVGIILLLVAALGVVVQLKDALNTIWEVDQDGKTGVWAFARSYVVSLAGILGLGFLVAVSLIFSTALAAITASFGMSASEGIFWHSVDLVLSLMVLSLLFGMLFKFFPDAAIQWRDVWPGAFVTAVLFEVGKMAIAWYIGMEGLQSTYGAAASLVVLLIWVYYASQIVLFGAELTHVYAAQRRSEAKWTAGGDLARPEPLVRSGALAAERRTE